MWLIKYNHLRLLVKGGALQARRIGEKPKGQGWYCIGTPCELGSVVGSVVLCIVYLTMALRQSLVAVEEGEEEG
jgi:hypothetical protein